jgi:signal transduction histidine kinase/ActR/RegA family two-component response regulator
MRRATGAEGLALAAAEAMTPRAAPRSRTPSPPRGGSLWRALFREVLASAPDALFAIGGAGAILYANAEGERLIGRSAESLAGLPITEILPEIGVALGGSSAAQDVRIGEEIYAVRVQRVPEAPEGCLAVTLHRVTEERRQSDEKRRADLSRDDSIAWLAHEMRNPLTPLLHAVDVLRCSGAVNASSSSALEAIDRQVGHMARVVEDLLDLSSIIAGRFSIRCQAMDLCAVLRSCAEDHREEVESAGLRLVSAISEGPIWTLGDSTRIAQAIGHLIHNACKFTSSGGEIRLCCRELDQRARITVADTGCGISEDMLQRIFESFVQGDTGRDRGGLGVGLALVERLVALHDGKVRAFSGGPGFGAEIRVELPIRPPAPVLRRPEKSGPPVHVARRRVLIIENDEDVAESLSIVLRLAGHDALVAHEGSLGIESVQRVSPDVVLCDLGLPGAIDGYVVARAIRADQRSCRVALVAVSGTGREENERHARKAGFDAYLTKPIAPDTLRDLVSRIRPQPHPRHAS